MSKTNYSNYSKGKTNSEQVEIGLNHTTISTNHTEPLTIKLDSAPIEEVHANAPIIEPMVETVETVSVPNTVIGTVTDCVRLNIRVAPFANAEIACVVDSNSQLEINDSESVADWYKVCTASGIEGYCMRRYVTVK